MTDFGVTSTGYVVKTLDVMNTETQAALEKVTDPATGESLQVNFDDPSDIVSQIVSIVTEQVAQGILVDQAAYNQFDPGKATEDALSSLMLINSLFRKPASKSTVLVDFTGSPSTQGTFETDVIGTFAAFNAVSDGEFEVTIDGDTQDILSLDFTLDTDYDGIALTIQAGLQAIGAGGYTSATVASNSPTAPAQMIITSGGLGSASTVSVLSAVGGGVGTDISGVTYLNGVTGLVVPGISSTVLSGLEITDTTRINIWETVNDFTFDILGIATGISATSAVRGSISANAGTLTQLVSTSEIVSTLSNPLDATVGREVETDNTARRRRDLSQIAPSIGLAGSIFANVSQVEGVTFARLYNNETLVPDANGIIGKSVGLVVLGGDDVEIAQSFMERKSIGASYSGTTTVNFVDNLGTLNEVKFYRPTPVLIDIEVSITLDAGAGLFPDDGATQIKDAIAAYSTGGAAALGITEGFDITGFPPGQAVLLSRLYTPVNSIPGHKVNSITMKKTADAPPFLPADIPIAFDEVSDIQAINIIVLVI